jgi:flavin reductase (DIM6/NTAB) family NADH-FMN oxidoreductase RutF
MATVLEMIHWHEGAIEKMEGEYRRNLINSISGYKSANLIGTCDAEGQTNLAIFSSVVHIGANPAYMGIVMRPITVPRHTYNNIKETHYFTINAIQKCFYEKAHQTSANYPASLSEFNETGLTPIYSELHTAPYVAESDIRIGLELSEELPIKSNGTIMIIGKVIEIQIAPSLVSNDGFLNLHKSNVLAITGLDGYNEVKPLGRMAYARPGTQPKPLK